MQVGYERRDDGQSKNDPTSRKLDGLQRTKDDNSWIQSDRWTIENGYREEGRLRLRG